jgi:hypothetical protein
MDVELQPETSDSAWQLKRQLARNLCTDAEQYGGHACLSCQHAARRLLAESDVDNAPGRKAVDGAVSVGGFRPPLHGTSLKTFQTNWRRVVSSTRNRVRQSADHEDAAL